MMRDTRGDVTSANIGGPSAAGSVERGRLLLTELRDLLHAAASDAAVSHGLARADTTVRVTLAEDGNASVTALLDREPIEVLPNAGAHAAEIELVLPSQVLERLFHEDYHLTLAIVRGEATFTGPVRKLLLVMPILQHFAETAAVCDTDGQAGSGADSDEALAGTRA